MTVAALNVALGDVDGLIDRKVFPALLEPAGPPHFEGVDFSPLPQPEMLLRRQAAKVAAAVHYPMLLASARQQLEPGADCVAIALRPGEPHGKIIPRPLLRAENRRRQQIAGVVSTGPHQDAEPSVAE